MLGVAIAAMWSFAVAYGQSYVSIDEPKIRAMLRNDLTVITIPVTSSVDHSIQANVVLYWLDTKDKQSGTVQREITILPGQSTLEIPFPITESSVWARLHYALTPNRPEAREFAQLIGIVAFSQIAPYVFEAKLNHVGSLRQGHPVIIHASAINPVTRMLLPEVKWTVRLTNGDRRFSPARTVKHPEGFIEFIFDLPTIPGEDFDDSVEVEATAKYGDFVQHVSSDYHFPVESSARIQSDKPIYQPGQTIHLRSVILDALGRAKSGATVAVQIEGPDYGRVHTVELESSKFGVIQDDWTIPSTALQGDYNIRLLEEMDSLVLARHMVRVSRYELPVFKVSAMPDRKAYLPGEAIKVAVAGVYFTGKPVPKGKVKLVRDGTSDKAEVQGETDSNGVFTARLDAKKDFDSLKKDGTNFQDLHFSAYCTDPTSGRTEQKRFDVRITLQSIHIYLIQSNGGHSSPIYLSTSYADGRPASTTVKIQNNGKSISLKTNRYGIGKVVVPEESETALVIGATDGTGVAGEATFPYWTSNAEGMRFETSQTLHRAGQSVKLRVTSGADSAAEQYVLIHSVVANREVSTRIAHLVNHQAEVTFPFQPEFRRNVTFVADTGSGTKNSVFTTVIFPDSADLILSAKPEKATYKPGEKATLQMQVTSVDGKPVQAALGLAVVDQAVLERARTDEEFGHRRWFDCAYCGNEGETEIGGMRLNDLYALKSSTPISADLDLVAEALVANLTADISSDSTEQDPMFERIALHMKQLKQTFDEYFAITFEFPQDISTLSDALGPAWTNLTDPWGMPFQPEFVVENENLVIRFKSAGPDKKYGTADDFEVYNFQRKYFTSLHRQIRDILKKQFQYPETETEFKRMLSENGILLDTLRDPWGNAYRSKITTAGTMRRITILSLGPDGKFGTKDDFSVGEFAGLYFVRERAAIVAAMQASTRSPQTRVEFLSTLAKSGIDISQFRDAWNRPYRLTDEVTSYYMNRIDSKTVLVFGSAPQLRSASTPVTRKFNVFGLRSAGADGIENTYDDFDIATFSSMLSEDDGKTEQARQPIATGAIAGKGAISGIVTDATGAVLVAAKIMLIDAMNSSFETTTNQSGRYEFAGVPAGLYSVHANVPGFRTYEVSRVPVMVGTTTRVDVQAEVGSVSESIAVTAESVSVQTSSSTVSSVAMSTPRVREYFPETLLWMPEIITDERGFAHTQFPLADSVTTWKIAVIASTLDGHFAEAESDLRAFQPFFLEFNPPPVLTEGDKISLPVTIRNYQEQRQKVSVKMQPNEWLTIAGSTSQERFVDANSSVNATYAMQARQAAEKAPLRVTATAGNNGDAIVKHVRIHPDGQEISFPYGDLVMGRTEFPVRISPRAINGASHGELRIYPNLSSLLLESASAMITAPHGCAEQTISAGYANLIAWQFAQAIGVTDPHIERAALANVRRAIDRLPGFHNGGIRYWQFGEPDIAVTAHAVHFLADASAVGPAVTASDQRILNALVTWLEEKQQKDGGWLKPDGNQSQLLSGLVARSLAAASKAGVIVQRNTLTGAYHNLARLTDQTDEPYMLSQFILALIDSGDEVLLGNAIARLTGFAREERGALYWDLQSNTPFYGWGTAARYETTGLAISALSAWRVKHPQATDVEPVIRRGLLFLLRGQDVWGGWSSSQSTLLSMRALVDASAALGNLGGNGGRMDVRINGRSIQTVTLPNNAKTTDPILLDVSKYLAAGDNKIELVPSNGSKSALVRFSSTHWVPWPEAKPRSSQELRFTVQFDRLEANAGDLVRCLVKAERVGFRGYGMMIAEVGLPPGAEVERSSLAVLAVDHYEIQPDRVIFYLWPKAGGVDFQFDLRMRMPMTAKNTTSILYDYYNPEALTEVVPVLWNMK